MRGVHRLRVHGLAAAAVEFRDRRPVRSRLHDGGRQAVRSTLYRRHSLLFGRAATLPQPLGQAPPYCTPSADTGTTSEVRYLAPQLQLLVLNVRHEVTLLGGPMTLCQPII